MLKSGGRKKESVKLEDLGQEIEKVSSDIGQKLASVSNTNAQVEIIRGALEDCIKSNNVLKALAIVDYVTHNTDVTSKNLNLIGESGDTPVPICSIAEQLGNDDWAIDFMGYCKDLHYDID